MARLSYHAHSVKPYPLHLDDHHRAMLQDLMGWQQKFGVQVIRELIADAHRKQSRKRKSKRPGGGE